MSRQPVFRHVLSSGRWLLVSLVTGLLSTVLAANILSPLELFAQDLLFIRRGPLDMSSQVVLVAIDDASFAQNDLQWPWPRSYMAQLVNNLAIGDPSVIAIDVQFYEPSSPSEDAKLARAIHEAGNVVLVEDISTSIRQGISLRQLNQPLPELREAAAAVGLAQFQRDDDGTLRQLLAFGSHNGEIHPSFAIQTVRLHLDAPSFDVASADVVEIDGDEVRLNDQYLRVNFLGPVGESIPTYSAYQVAEQLVDPSVFTDKIVIIGATAETIPLYDSYPTPYGNIPPMPGAEVNAHAVDTILNNRELTVVTPLAAVAVSSGAALLAAILVMRFRLLHSGIAFFGVGMIYGAVGYWAFVQFHTILSMFAPAFSFSLMFVSITTARLYTEQRARARVRALFERYVSPAAIDEMLARPDEVTVGGDRREVTVMFSDIRGFTALSEKLSPEEVVELLNDYLGAMTSIIFKHQGTVDKFEGDGILAIWNAPLDVDEHPRRAVECAIEMTQQLAAMQQRWEATGQQVLRNGIGIHTGVCFVGNIGSEQRMDYTVIGDGVNLAARVEALTKQLGVQILYTEATHAQLGETIRSRFVTSAHVVGREQPVKVYTVDPSAHGVATAPGVDLDALPAEIVQAYKR